MGDRAGLLVDRPRGAHADAGELLDRDAGGLGRLRHGRGDRGGNLRGPAFGGRRTAGLADDCVVGPDDDGLDLRGPEVDAGPEGPISAAAGWR